MRDTIGHPFEQAGGKVALHSDDAAHLAAPSGVQGLPKAAPECRIVFVLTMHKQ
jgi:hypothetical protein